MKSLVRKAAIFKLNSMSLSPLDRTFANSDLCFIRRRTVPEDEATAWQRSLSGGPLSDAINALLDQPRIIVAARGARVTATRVLRRSPPSAALR